MGANNIMEKLEEKKVWEEKKGVAAKQRQQITEAFCTCKQKRCHEKEGRACAAAGFKECSFCNNILKNQAESMWYSKMCPVEIQLVMRNHLLFLLFC